MDVLHRDVITSMTSFLVNNLDVDHLKPYMVEEELIRMDFNFSNLQQEEKIMTLLAQIMKQGPTAFQRFRQALQKADLEDHFVLDEVDRRLSDLQIIRAQPVPYIKDVLFDSKPVSYFYKTAIYEKAMNKLKTSKAVALCGLPGAGKSQLAMALKEELIGLNADTDNMGIKLNCTSETSLLGDLKRLASALKLSEVEVVDLPKQVIHLLLKKIIGRLDKSNETNVLIFDGIEEDLTDIITVDVLQNHKYYSICTVNNALCYERLQVKIEGFTKIECINFCRKRAEDIEAQTIFTGITDSDLESLGKELGYLPLGIVQSINAIKIGEMSSVTSYIKALNAGSQTKNTFEEGEYDKDLTQAIQVCLRSVKESLGDSDTWDMFNTLALLDGQRIPLDLIKVMLSGDTGEREKKTLDLLYKIRQFSLAEVYRLEDKKRYLDIHNAVQRALKLLWENEKEKRRNVENTIIMLANLAHKDDRYPRGFKQQVSLLPHIESVLKSLQSKSVESTLAQMSHVWLHLCIAHLYGVKGGIVKEVQDNLQKALKLFKKYFFKGEDQVLKYLKGDQPLHNCVENVVAHLTNMISNEDETRIIESFILKQQLINEKLEEFEIDRDETDLTNLTEDEYDDLQDDEEEKKTYPKDKVARAILGELLATLLYSLGKSYFSAHNINFLVQDEQTKLKKHVHQRAFEYAELVGKELRKHHDVSILAEFLAHAHGTLYFCCRTEDKSNEEITKDAEYAKSEYEKILDSTTRYYEFGIYKVTTTDAYCDVIYSRQLLKCNLLLLKHSPAHNKSAVTDQARKSLQDIQAKFRGKESENVRAKSTLYSDWAKVLLTIGDSADVNKAKELLFKSCDIEEKEEIVRFCWLEALHLLVDMTKTNPDMKIDVHGRVRKCLDRKGNSTGNTKLDKAIDELLQNLDPNVITPT